MFSSDYSFSFMTLQNINLLHLAQWQYWFWFFFTLFFGLYYVCAFTLLGKRVFSNSPKIATSFRSHGKWGDLLVCFVPISWCLNILTNSNYILRLVEWQSETHSYSLRVRGKQWYWVYKLSSMNALFFAKNPLEVGYFSWFVAPMSGSLPLLTYLSSQTKSLDQLSYSNLYSLYSDTYTSEAGVPGTLHRVPRFLRCLFLRVGLNVGLDGTIPYLSPVPLEFSAGTDLPSSYSHHTTFFLGKGALLLPSPGNISGKLGFEEFEIKPSLLAGISVSSQSGHLKSSLVELSTTKEVLDPVYVVLKQKRFHYKTFVTGFSGYNSLFSSGSSAILSEYTKNFFYNSYVDNKRLLRTFRLLVLPTNVNISVITNSFDVIHSWFIPGLGLKLDCVPGRSTHHTLHILNPGFYYGQCAEICGRFHHHMPIRLVALQYPQFIFWWHNKGIKQLLSLRYKGPNTYN